MEKTDARSLSTDAHPMIAVFASFDMAIERRGAAALDGAHHFELAQAQMAGVGGAPGSAMVAEDGLSTLHRMLRRLGLRLKKSR